MFEGNLSKKNPLFIINVILFLSLITSLIVIALLVFTINKSKMQVDILSFEIESLNETFSSKRLELENYQMSFLELKKQIQDYEKRISAFEEKERFFELKNGEIIINKYMTKEAIHLLETFVTAISNSDKELYLSLINDEPAPAWSSDITIEKYHEYLLVPYERLKGTKLTIKKIETSNPFRGTESEINDILGGWYYVRVIVEDDKGNYEVIMEIGIIKDPNNDVWKINDYH